MKMEEQPIPLTNLKPVILSLIEQDFKLINLFERLDQAGFIGLDFPNITYEIFDLMEIPEQSRTDKLLDQYTEWAKQIEWLKLTGGTNLNQYFEDVYDKLCLLKCQSLSF